MFSLLLHFLNFTEIPFTDKLSSRPPRQGNPGKCRSRPPGQIACWGRNDAMFTIDNSAQCTPFSTQHPEICFSINLNI